MLASTDLCLLFFGVFHQKQFGIEVQPAIVSANSVLLSQEDEDLDEDGETKFTSEEQKVLVIPFLLVLR